MAKRLQIELQHCLNLLVRNNNMASKFYPDIKRLFAEVNKGGRPLSYTPEEVLEEFIKYIDDLSTTPISVEVEYRQQKQGSGEQRSMQQRKQNYYRPPKVYDFVVRWLGKSASWWRMIGESKRHGKKFLTVKEKIERYCFDCKYDGAVIGLYNANIIARDLGLKDKVEVEQKQLGDDMTTEEITKELARMRRNDNILGHNDR